MDVILTFLKCRVMAPKGDVWSG